MLFDMFTDHKYLTGILTLTKTGYKNPVSSTARTLQKEA